LKIPEFVKKIQNALEHTEKSLMFSAAVENPDSKNNLLLRNLIYGRYPAIAQE
jgi:hypothetical protein